MRTTTRVALAAALALVVIGGFRWAESEDEWGRTVLKAHEVHDGWLFASGQTVLIEGTVNGDLYAAGGEVEISGTVNGDVLVAGGTVEIGGTVAEDVRATGGTVRISGTVGGNCTAAGGSIVLASDGVVKDNLLGLAGTIRISGKAERELRVACEELIVSGHVGKDLRFSGEKIQILQGAMVDGNAAIAIAVAEKAEIAPGAVRGNVELTITDEESEAGLVGSKKGAIALRILYGLSLILIAFLAAFVLPHRTSQARSLLAEDFGMSFLWGLLGLLGLPAAAFLIMALVIGIPLGLFVLVMYLWFLYVSQLSLPLLASHWIVKKEGARGWRLFWPVALGIIVLQLLMVIPYLGFLLWLVGAILGIGALLRIVGPALAEARAPASGGEGE